MLTTQAERDLMQVAYDLMQVAYDLMSPPEFVPADDQELTERVQSTIESALLECKIGEAGRDFVEKCVSAVTDQDFSAAMCAILGRSLAEILKRVEVAA